MSKYFVAPKKTSETNSTQPRNENREDLVEDESIPLSQVQGQENHLPIIDEPIPLSQVQIQGQENHLSVIDLSKRKILYRGMGKIQRK